MTTKIEKLHRASYPAPKVKLAPECHPVRAPAMRRRMADAGLRVFERLTRPFPMLCRKKPPASVYGSRVSIHGGTTTLTMTAIHVSIDIKPFDDESPVCIDNALSESFDDCGHHDEVMECDWAVARLWAESRADLEKDEEVRYPVAEVFTMSGGPKHEEQKQRVTSTVQSVRTEGPVDIYCADNDGPSQSSFRNASDEVTVNPQDQVFSPDHSRLPSWETDVGEVFLPENKLEMPPSPATVIYHSEERLHFDSPSLTDPTTRHVAADDYSVDGAHCVSANSTRTAFRYYESDVNNSCSEATSRALKTIHRTDLDGDAQSLWPQVSTQVRVSSMREYMQSQQLKLFCDSEDDTDSDFDLGGEIDLNHCHGSILSAEEYYGRGLIQEIHADIQHKVVSSILMSNDSECDDNDRRSDFKIISCAQTSNHNELDRHKDLSEESGAIQNLGSVIQKSLSAYLESTEPGVLSGIVDSGGSSDLWYHQDESNNKHFLPGEEEISPSEYSSQEDNVSSEESHDGFSSFVYDNATEHSTPHQERLYYPELSPIPELPTPAGSVARFRHRDPVKAPPHFTLGERNCNNWSVDTQDLNLVPSPLRGCHTPLLVIPPRSSSRQLPTPGSPSELSNVLNQLSRSTTGEESYQLDVDDSLDSPEAVVTFGVAASAPTRSLVKGLRSFFKSKCGPERRPVGTHTFRRTARRLFSAGASTNVFLRMSNRDQAASLGIDMASHHDENHFPTPFSTRPCSEYLDRQKTQSTRSPYLSPSRIPTDDAFGSPLRAYERPASVTPRRYTRTFEVYRDSPAKRTTVLEDIYEQ